MLSVYDYIDYRDFLQAYYSWSKERDVSFSYTTWADQAGITSRSFLRLVVTGKRNLTKPICDKLIKTIEFNPDERLYFKAMVDFGQTESSTEKLALLKKMKTSAQGFKQGRSHLDVCEYLLNDSIPRIHTLLSFHDIDKTPPVIARMTGLKLEIVSDVLSHLKKLGQAIEDELGNWSSTTEVFEISDKVNNAAVRTFHQNSLQHAQESLQLDSSSRYFQSIFIALDDSQYTLACQEVDRFTDKMVEIFNSESGKEKKLYQLNSNLIPIADMREIQ